MPASPLLPCHLHGLFHLISESRYFFSVVFVVLSFIYFYEGIRLIQKQALLTPLWTCFLFPERALLGCHQVPADCSPQAQPFGCPQRIQPANGYRMLQGPVRSQEHTADATVHRRAKQSLVFLQHLGTVGVRDSPPTSAPPRASVTLRFEQLALQAASLVDPVSLRGRA